MKSYYDLLGVDHRASTRSIEQRYRNYLTAHIARHGARPLGRAKRVRLQQMRTAYLLLSSPRRRALYDRELQLAMQQRAKHLQTGGTLLGTAVLMLGLALIGSHSWLPTEAGPRTETDVRLHAQAPVQASSPMLVATDTAVADRAQNH